MSKHYAVSRARWQQAQRAALNFWQNNKPADERKKAEDKYLPVMRPYTDKLAADASILEIGCGALCLIHSLPQKNKTYLDPLIDDLRRMFPGELSDGEYLSGTAENIRKDDHCFDLIVCLNTIAYSLNPELVMNEIKRLLKQDGLLMLSLRVHSGLEARLHYLAERWLPWLCRGTCPYYYSYTGIRNTLERHFSIEEDILLDEQWGWLPGFSRQEHLFVCSLKSPNTQAPNNPSTPS